jgi:lipopolysaccharide transport system ATP-binding protein
MSKPIIEVEHVSKCYRIGAMREPYLSLREELAKKTRRISSAFSRAFRKGQAGPSSSETDFWALNDVSFSVQEGEAVGIIGRNGAGKSTLLKILSQITPPTKGRIIMRGRVASLLEVGTGFHNELSGRENIFLNGAILGMTRAEIRKKFDEIVAFSEIEKFLDTPVKRYSSGMYVRLAFAVAAHLEPEILIVDEVLAVGDAQFQKKCLGKMADVGKEGRTVLFVSHNMGAIRTLCENGLILNKGSLVFQGNIENTIKKYIGNDINKSYIYLADVVSKGPFVKKISVYLTNNKKESYLNLNESITIEFIVETFNMAGVVLGFVIRNGHDIWVHHTSDEFALDPDYSEKVIRFCDIPPYALAEGTYYLDVSLGKRNVELYQTIRDSIVFDVHFSGKVSDKTTGTDWRGTCGPGQLCWR